MLTEDLLQNPLLLPLQSHNMNEDVNIIEGMKFKLIFFFSI